MLQWGRDVIVADGLRRVRVLRRQRHASMGPRRYRRGWFKSHIGRELRRSASMGPRRYRRGWTITVDGTWEREWLQWGRDVIVADGEVRPSKYDAKTAKLQWGRDVIVADGWASATRRGTPSANSFNGAATLSSRMVHRVDLAGETSRVLQWGRDVIVADGRNGVQLIAARPGASMGPRRYRRGWLRSSPNASPRCELQWGRDVIVADGWLTVR